MRLTFSNLLLAEMNKCDSIVLLTADLGYGLWDAIKAKYPGRFYNMGSSEQLMIGAAAGMALSGLIPVCYSITPFLIFRPMEWIRVLINHDKIPVKLVGSGRDRDYGNLGFTHWADDVAAHMVQFRNIDSYTPKTTRDLEMEFQQFIHSGRPAYINLSK